MTTEWNEFCKKATQIMEGALSNKLTLEDADIFFTQDKTIRNSELRRYIEYLIWEIDGYPDRYQELLALFKAEVSEEELIRHLGGQISEIHRWPWT